MGEGHKSTSRGFGGERRSIGPETPAKGKGRRNRLEEVEAAALDLEKLKEAAGGRRRNQSQDPASGGGGPPLGFVCWQVKQVERMAKKRGEKDKKNFNLVSPTQPHPTFLPSASPFPLAEL